VFESIRNALLSNQLFWYCLFVDSFICVRKTRWGCRREKFAQLSDEACLFWTHQRSNCQLIKPSKILTMDIDASLQAWSKIEHSRKAFILHNLSAFLGRQVHHSKRACESPNTSRTAFIIHNSPFIIIFRALISGDPLVLDTLDDCSDYS